jgi:2-polyprenyl-6-hydroxyphenyl methylase/3-demethylubiquinone-9 3-methyltransferase
VKVILVKRNSTVDKSTARDAFDFGANWRNFLSCVTQDRIDRAIASLSEVLESHNLWGKRFLDAGCGSGLFSLAARRLGASVVSIDADSGCVRCAQELRASFESDSTKWEIKQGSVLDAAFLRTLGHFDVVYCWGVLHHTGSMWQGLARVAEVMRDEGRLVVAIYNDQGQASVVWRRIKHSYNKLPKCARLFYVLALAGAYELRSAAYAILTFRPSRYFSNLNQYSGRRGMSRWHDWIDWIGGYPFEVARPDDVLEFCAKRNLTLIKLRTAGRSWGCNEFVFARTTEWKR